MVVPARMNNDVLSSNNQRYRKHSSIQCDSNVFQGTVRPNMTTGLIGPLEQSQDPVARQESLVFMPEVGLASLPLLLFDQDRF